MFIFWQRVMDQKFMLAALPSGIQLARILLKLTAFLQIHLLTNASALFHAPLVLAFLEMHWKNYLSFAFPLLEVGKVSFSYERFSVIWIERGGNWDAVFIF